MRTRGFVKYILDPIIALSEACMGMKREKIDKMLVVLGVKLTTKEKELKEKKLLKAIIRKWIDASVAILQMMVLHLPSPLEA